MKTFTLTDLNRVAGDIIDAAMMEPVTLTKYGKERLVVLNAELYHRLTSNTVQAFTLDNAPPEVIDELMTGLDLVDSKPNL